MPEWKKGEQPDGSKTGRTEATNSQRMFKVLEVLKKHSDSNNRMTQEQILAALKKINFGCNIKTLRQTLVDLIMMMNPAVIDDNTSALFTGTE